MKKIILKTFVLSALLFSSCKQQSESYSDQVLMEPVAETIDSNSVSSNEQAVPLKEQKSVLENLKIIKNAQARFKVKNIDKATEEAKKIVTQYNGYLSNMRFQNNNYQLENRFTVRLPRQHFDSALKQLSELAIFVDHTNITTTDVTEEYVDLQARLKTKLEIKSRYEKILKGKSKTVEDVLLAEAKIGSIQEEIEAAQGRLKFLSNKVALSTIQVDLYQTVEYKDQPDVYIQSFGSKILDGLNFGWKMLQNLFLGLLYIWPLVLLGFGLYYYIRYRIRKSK